MGRWFTGYWVREVQFSLCPSLKIWSELSGRTPWLTLRQVSDWLILNALRWALHAFPKPVFSSHRSLAQSSYYRSLNLTKYKVKSAWSQQKLENNKLFDNACFVFLFLFQDVKQETFKEFRRSVGTIKGVAHDVEVLYLRYKVIKIQFWGTSDVFWPCPTKKM